MTFNFPDSWEPTPPCKDSINILVLYLAELSLHAHSVNITLFMHFSSEKVVTSSQIQWKKKKPKKKWMRQSGYYLSILKGEGLSLEKKKLDFLIWGNYSFLEGGRNELRKT